MPVLDVQLVVRGSTPQREGLAAALAEAAAEVFGSPTGRVWVRMSLLPIEHYAENGVASSALPCPVFVKVLLAKLPAETALLVQAQSLSKAVATVIGCASELVHIEYSPEGEGRVAFGGRLVLPQ